MNPGWTVLPVPHGAEKNGVLYQSGLMLKKRVRETQLQLPALLADGAHHFTFQIIPMFDRFACFYTSLWFALSVIQSHVAPLPCSRKAEAAVEKDVAADEAANGGTAHVPDLLFGLVMACLKIGYTKCHESSSNTFMHCIFPNLLMPTTWLIPLFECTHIGWFIPASGGCW